MTSKSLADSTVDRADGRGAALAPAARRRARRTLVLLAIVCVLPVALSYFMYYVWAPSATVNHGELLEPAPMPPDTLQGAAGQPEFPRSELDGQWTLVTAAPAACDRACAGALYSIRQSRLAQGKEMQRVARLWLVRDGGAPAPATLAGHDGLRIAHVSTSWLARLPGADESGTVWLIDPLGRVMMRYPGGAAPQGLIKDLQRLLKYSPLGRPQ